MSATILRLSVSGTVFHTRSDTLCRTSSYFALLMQSQRGPDVFVDRDPTHFRHVLNYLRGATTFPETLQGLRELRLEADFFSLQGLVDDIATEWLARCESEQTSTDALARALRPVQGELALMNKHLDRLHSQARWS